jgi:transposase InsO family protein
VTLEGRRRLVGLVLFEGWALGAAAGALATSRQTASKWVRRYVEEGEGGLLDRSSAPRRIPHRTPQDLVDQVLRLRHRRLVGWAIARQLALARSTVGAILRRHGLGRLSALDPPPRPVRYEWERPGELLHLDTKKLGRIAGVGHRIHGDRRTRQRGIGWEFAHVAIDDHSRLSYVEVLPDERIPRALAFLERALAFFASQGIARVERIMTDNGCAYVSRAFAAFCEQRSIRHLRTRPYTPRTNGKAERFIQTLQREWAYAAAYPSSRERTRALRSYLLFYNHRRPHSALGLLPPSSRVQGCEQRA